MKTKHIIFYLLVGFLLIFSEKSIAQAKLEAKTLCPNMKPFVASFGTFTICNGYNLILYTNQGSGLTYQWLLNGKAINGATSNIYYASVPGKYSVWVTKQGCINISDEVDVTVGNYPDALLTPSADTVIFEGDSVELSIKGGASWQWYKNYIPIPGATQKTFFAKDSGYYHAEARNKGCAMASKQIKVTVKDRPDLIFSNSDLILGLNDTILLQVDQPGTFQWYKNQKSLQGETNNFLNVFSAGKYAVEIHTGTEIVLSAEVVVTEEFILSSNHPAHIHNNVIIKNNPFQESAVIEFRDGYRPEEIIISDMQGKVIFRLSGKEVPKEFNWGENGSKGMYIMILKKDNSFEAIRLIKN